MTNKDALRIIKFQMKDECLSCGTFECSESDFFCDTREAFIFSIKALEKQIPKKPYRISNSILHCSVCSSPVRLGEDGSIYAKMPLKTLKLSIIEGHNNNFRKVVEDE